MNILVLGASSAIATACARKWASNTNKFYLVARSADKLDTVKNDLIVRGAIEVNTLAGDMCDQEFQNLVVASAFSHLVPIDIVLLSYGTLPEQSLCEKDSQLAMREFSNNATSAISFLIKISPKMKAQKNGCIAVISSVAGDRGRPSNYLYGSAKAAVSTFCEGLRANLFKSGVHVLTIKPGFVNTPMTQGLPLPQRLIASPDKVASDITKAVRKRNNTLYTPWFWRWIMFIICSIPTAIFKRMRL